VRTLVAVLGCTAWSALAPKLGAQQTQCSLVQQPTTRLTVDSTAEGQVAFVGGGVLIRCPARGITLRGDSAEEHPDRDVMIGNAVYDEPRLHVTADFLNYFPSNERVVASGHVHGRLPSGSTLEGPQAEWLRVTPSRPRQQMRAIGRPTITIVEQDSAGHPVPPTTVVANNVFMDGDSLIYGGGQVVITRPNIGATADSAFIDETREIMRLLRNPTVTGTQSRPFKLTGDIIDLFSHNRKLERVLSRSNATALSDSMTLSADTIDLRVRNDALDHAYAWGASRARAVSPTQTLVADSLDVDMPAQKVQLVRAIRNAFAQGKPDTTHFKLEPPDTTDWLKGDTITAHFDTMPPRTASATPRAGSHDTSTRLTSTRDTSAHATKDTSNAPNIRQLVASGHASALYHMTPNDTASHRPAINHVTARIITIDFESRQVTTVSTVDSVFGIVLEPRADSTTRRATANPGKPGTTPPKTPPRRPAPPPVVPKPAAREERR
jgi:hypothetical protein